MRCLRRPPPRGTLSPSSLDPPRKEPSMRLLAILAAFAVLGPQLHAQSGIVPPGSKLEKIWDGGVVRTEGVAVAPDGMVYFSDITFSHVSKDKNGAIEAGHIWKHDPKTGK